MPKKRRRQEEIVLSQQIHEKKRLLIFDLNKVLVYRVKNTNLYDIRPFAAEFLRDLSEEYTFAVWTSMKQKTTKKIVRSLFHSDDPQPQSTDTQMAISCDSSSSRHVESANGPLNIAIVPVVPLPSLLFKWTQTKCTASVGTGNRSSSERINRRYGDDNDKVDEDAEMAEESDLVLAKDLARVWREFPQYHQFSTILLDDSPEKCYLNPTHTVLHPHPYLGPEHSPSDAELQPGGALWRYLMDLAKTVPLDDTDGFVRRAAYVSPMSNCEGNPSRAT